MSPRCWLDKRDVSEPGMFLSRLRVAEGTGGVGAIAGNVALEKCLYKVQSPGARTGLLASRSPKEINWHN